MKRFAWLLVAALALAGCSSTMLKDKQRKDIIADSDTKIYYKNVPTTAEKIPKEKRVYFASREDAEAAGYTNYQEGGAPDSDSGDQPKSGQ